VVEYLKVFHHVGFFCLRRQEPLQPPEASLAKKLGSTEATHGPRRGLGACLTGHTDAQLALQGSQAVDPAAMWKP
jgi:hypothetical protein